MSVTAAYYAAMISLGLVAAVIGPTLAALATQTGTPISAIGVIFSAQSLGYLIGSLQSGRWFDRLPGHRVLAIALVIIVALVALIPAMTTLWALAAALLLIGAATGTLDVGTNTLLLWRYQARIGGVMNGLHFCFGIGSLAAPAIVAWSIRATDGIAVAYWTMAVLIAPMVLWFFRLPSAPAPIRRSGHEPPPTDYRLIVLITTVFALYVAAEVGYGGWISTYAVTLGFGDAAEAAYLTAAFWGTLTFGRLVGIPLASRFRATTIIAVDLLGSLFSVITILLFPESAGTLWIATCALGFCLASIFPMLLVFSGERMAVTGRSTSWYMAGAGVGGMTLPWLIGQLFVAAGPHTLMWLVAATLLAGAGVFLLAALRPPVTAIADYRSTGSGAR